ncbi:winged helix-turn-helix transcriptional regulator [Arthrobacter sp. ATA002]|uniref:ROK family transcriptional regulator n=1 Tax=Arthrobacter sp. ATA002 TaxID=2991715 RepID=UPI0022A6BF36|nr:ROK family transcriptional regulator [Arthrobacter sp. ATA002]WAP53182.1 winged helix-turn-helix transcriptional regulator [Arthrobacter sp. ATA002]
MNQNRPRESSRGKILDLIRVSGPVSRVELAEMTGLTQATISTAVRSLLNDGVVLEAGRGESTGGKPRMLLELNPASRLGLGVHIGQDYITYVVADLSGRVVGRRRVSGPGNATPMAVVSRITADVDNLFEALAVDRQTVVGMGVAAPGPWTGLPAP